MKKYTTKKIRNQALFELLTKHMKESCLETIGNCGSYISFFADETLKKKKVNKSKGGYKADKTKKSPTFRESDWIELDCHTFSVNYHYHYVGGRKVRTEQYNNWINNFPRRQVTPKWKLYQNYGIRVSKPFVIEMEVVQKAESDIDNGIKSFLDMLVDVWDLKDDNHIVGVNIRRIGTCDSFKEGKIRFRLIQEVI